MTVVERIREICKDRGIKIANLEKDLGWSNGYLNPKKTETVSVDKFVAFCEYVDMDIYDALGIKKTPPVAGEREELIRRFDALDPQGQAAVLAAIKALVQALSSQDEHQ